MITLDVQRSISTMPGVDAEALQRVLKAYAVHHPEFGYCQGMNFVAGFIMMIYNDETTTFRVLVALIRKFKIEKLFDSFLPRLRLFFFFNLTGSSEWLCPSCDRIWLRKRSRPGYLQVAGLSLSSQIC